MNIYAPAPEQSAAERFASLPENPARGLDWLLSVLLVNSASDLHIQAEESPRIRKDGALIPVSNPQNPSENIAPVSRATVVRMVENLLTGDVLSHFQRAEAVALEGLLRTEEARMRRVQIFEAQRSQGLDVDSDRPGFDADVAYSFRNGEARFRVNVSLDRGNPRIVMRQIPTTIRTVSQLRLPDSLLSLTTLTRGLVLVTGPTGSGKSTTLAALVDHINETRSVSILTIEDPIEFVHHSKRSMVAQREIGKDTPGFGEALRRAMRQDPDVILVGELRDLETTRIALEAAETGHLVFGTLHTKSAKDTLTRIVNQFPEGEQEQIRATLAGALRGVIAQVLIPKRVGSGRVAALEIMHVRPEIRAQLANPAGFSQIEDSIRASKEHGNQLLDESLYQLAEAGEISVADALRVAMQRKPLSDRLERIGLRAAAL